MGFVKMHGSPFLSNLAESGKSAVVPLTIGDSESAGVLGCIAIFASLFIGHFTVAAMHWRLKPSEHGFAGGLAALRFPSASLNLSGALFQGVAIESMRIFGSETATITDSAIAAVALSLFIASPVVLLFWASKYCCEEFISFSGLKLYDDMPSVLRLLILPTGFWRTTSLRSEQMRASYGGFRCSNCFVFLLLAPARSLTLSIVVAFGGSLGCSLQSAIIGGAFLIGAILLVVARPFLTRSRLFFGVVISLTTTYVIMAAQVASLQKTLGTVATVLAVVSMVNVGTALAMNMLARRWRAKVEPHHETKENEASQKPDFSPAIDASPLLSPYEEMEELSHPRPLLAAPVAYDPPARKPRQERQAIPVIDVGKYVSLRSVPMNTPFRPEDGQENDRKAKKKWRKGSSAKFTEKKSLW